MDVVVEASHLPKLDETVFGSGVNYLFGGKGGNQALAADGHGASVYFIGRVGNDDFGRKLLAKLSNGSVDTCQIQTDSGASGMSVAILEKKGDYGAVIVSGSNLNIDKNKIFITEDTGILLIQNEVPVAINLEASMKAKKNGAEVWLNAAPARKIPSELLRNLDVVIINRIETEYYEDILQSPECNHITKIITLGDSGVKIDYPNNLKQYFPAYSVKVHSTHGAGDVFIGALAARRLLNQTFEQAIRYSQAAAALKVSKKVTEEDKVTPAAVFEFLQIQPQG